MKLADYTLDDLPDDIIEHNDQLRKQSVVVNDTGQLSPKFLEFTNDNPLSQAPIIDGATSAKPLENWIVEAQIYKDAAAANVGFFASLFSMSADTVSAGVIHDAMRFTFERNEHNRKLKVGVSVKLVVATEATNIDFDISLPNLAADAQLNGSNSRIGIYVNGYAGPLADLLPAPSKLDVETAMEYMESFRDIQRRVFSADMHHFIVPVTLAYDDKANTS